MWNATLANDGNHETNTIKGDVARCTASRPEPNPWWAVDLGRPTTIYRVDLTNAGWCDYGFLLLFCFGVSQTSVIVHNCSFLICLTCPTDIILCASVSVTLLMMRFMQKYVEMLKELDGDPE